MFKKSDLVVKVSENLGVSKKEAEEKVVEGFIKALEDLLMDETEDGIDIYNFAEFKVVDVPSRQARNPRTGETITTEEKVICKVKLKARLKNLKFEK